MCNCFAVVPTAYTQEKLGVLLQRVNPDLLLVGAHLDPSASSGAGYTASHPQSSTALAQGARKIHIGFVSKFFTANHAHGQLLRVWWCPHVLFVK